MASGPFNEKATPSLSSIVCEREKNHVRQLLTQKDLKEPMFSSYQQVYRAWVTYESLQSIRPLPFYGQPGVLKTPEQRQAFAARIVDALFDTSRLGPGPLDKHQAHALQFLRSLKPFEIQLIAWKLLQRVECAQNGLHFRPMWDQIHQPSIRFFETFRARFATLIMVLENSKCRCQALFVTQTQAVNIFASNPTVRIDCGRYGRPSQAVENGDGPFPEQPQNGSSSITHHASGFPFKPNAHQSAVSFDPSSPDLVWNTDSQATNPQRTFRGQIPVATQSNHMAQLQPNQLPHSLGEHHGSQDSIVGFDKHQLIAPSNSFNNNPSNDSILGNDAQYLVGSGGNFAPFPANSGFATWTMEDSVPRMLTLDEMMELNSILFGQHDRNSGNS